MGKGTPMRLNKFISESGMCSRREADRYIETGNVLLNGRKAKIGDQVFPTDKVMVNGHEIEGKTSDNMVLIAFNKPVGITSTTELSVKGNIVDFVNHSERIFPIGRLDKDSQGLILLTNNGDIVNKILRAGNQHEKEYLVSVDKPITEDFITGMANGVPILGQTTKNCLVVKETPLIFKITLIQGMNRQIRRMCDYFGYEVVKLERVRIMSITLKGLPVGEWRELSKPELDGVLKLVENSKSNDSKMEAYVLEKTHNKSKSKKVASKATPHKAPSNPDKRKVTKMKSGKSGKPAFGFGQKGPSKNKGNKGRGGRK